MENLFYDEYGLTGWGFGIIAGILIAVSILAGLFCSNLELKAFNSRYRQNIGLYEWIMIGESIGRESVIQPRELK